VNAEYFFELNVVVEWLTLLLRILEVSYWIHLPSAQQLTLLIMKDKAVHVLAVNDCLQVH
jgi:hypothetical protein